MFKKTFTAPLVIAIVFFASIGIIRSQEEGQVTDISLGYAPVSQELHINPGDTYSDKVTLWNLSDSDTEYFVKVVSFKQIENYPSTAIPLTDEENLISTSSASSWVRIETESIVVPSQMNFELNYLIEVPEDAQPGEYYAQIFFYTDQQATQTDSIVTLNNLAGGPTFLIKTGDDLTESLEVLEFKTTHKIFEQPAEVTFETNINNTGNVHLKPRGTIVLTNMFGQEIGSIEFNASAQTVLRDSIAKYITEWESNYLLTEEGYLAVGPITAELTLNYKSESPGFSPVTAETTFWILQWRLGLAILGAIVVIVWTIKSVKKSKKKETVKTIKEENDVKNQEGENPKENK